MRKNIILSYPHLGRHPGAYRNAKVLLNYGNHQCLHRSSLLKCRAYHSPSGPPVGTPPKTTRREDATAAKSVVVRIRSTLHATHDYLHQDGIPGEFRRQKIGEPRAACFRSCIDRRFHSRIHRAGSR
ncbi:hypothetical protein DF3PB_30029 [uncultured Defluviicoccus sp.]|uniref:Uncharacterized protein n=1 Tax=metagenome TaxID=256318 RepID=A0A380TE61_9ZZZZ|nr:hypothetical protein DF3PB_30029 [uncultured Defluviicoccus sp.]